VRRGYEVQDNKPVFAESFSGMVAVVTGAAQGIGRAIAEDLHARGAHLVLIDRNAARVVETAAAMRHPDRPAVDPVIADLTDPSAIEQLAPSISGLASKVDVLVNNAAIELDLPFRLVTSDVFDQVIAINLRAPLLVSQALAPLFPAEGGAIVNISSIHASHAFPNSIPYACSKAGLVALTRNLALELASRKIRVNAVCPGYIDTPMWEEWLRTAKDPESLASETEALHPLGRRGLPADVAAAVAYFAGSQAAWVTGTHLVVDGGLTIRAHP
jgi:NAD(P)-dependent dehydrogenase (short-subunit alcohol dehydrogenase family)